MSIQKNKKSISNSLGNTKITNTMLLIKITTHASLDVTWKSIFESFSTTKDIKVESFTTPETDDSFEEDFETFTFKSFEAISEFLIKAPSMLIEELATSTGDDAYFDYTWSFLAQYKEILEAIITLIKGTNPENDYLIGIKIPRAIKLNVEIFNEVLLKHQDSNGGPKTEDQYYAGEIEPINL